MSRRYTYTTMDRVFSKLIREVTNEFNEGDIIEYTGEALEAIHCEKSFQEGVIFLEVKNHQVEIPKGVHNIIQIARNRNWNGNSLSCVRDAAKECVTDNKFDFAVFNLGNDSVSFAANWTFDFGWHPWRDSNCYRSNYTPVRLATHSFFNSLVCEVDDPAYSSSTDEYQVIAGTMLRFSFKEGLVAIACNKQLVDEKTGYPMIPDNYSYLTAIVMYIKMKLLQRQCYNGRQGTCELADKAEMQWQWYCGQATSIDMMPHGVDEYQNLLDQRNYLIPRESYYSFFGNMNKPEQRPFTDPNRRTRW